METDVGCVATNANDFQILIKKISNSGGASKIEEFHYEDIDRQQLIFLASRKVTSFKMKKTVGHSYLEFAAELSSNKTPSAPRQNPLPKKIKYIKIDSLKTAYRVIYNASPIAADEVVCDYTFGTPWPVDEVILFSIAVARRYGKWTEQFNCHAYAEALKHYFAQMGAAPTAPAVNPSGRPRRAGANYAK